MAQNDQAAETWLSTQRSYHPQLTEKAIIDLINGLEVVGDHLQCQSTRPLVERIWHTLTGRASREQYLIDINLKTGLEAVTAWVQDIQTFQAKSDLALAVVAEKLTETRTVLDRQAARQSGLKKALSQMQQHIDGLTQRVEEIVARDKAKDQRDILLSHWEETQGRVVSPLIQAFLTIDELWWGDFGRYCRLAQDTQAVNALIKLTCRKVAERLAPRLEHTAYYDFIAVETLLSSVAKMRDEQRELVCYLADRGTADRNPLFQAIARSAQGETDIVQTLPKLPRAFSPLSLSSRLLHESRRATAELTL